MNIEDNNMRNWTSKKELAEICGCDVRTITNIIDSLTKENDFPTQSHMKKDGYHNSEVFYDDYLVKLVQAKLKQNGMSQGKQIETVQQSNMMDMEVGMAANAVMASGSIEAAEQFASLLISRTRAVAENKQLQQANRQLQLENSRLREEAYNAYSEGFEEGRYRLNYMYRYDIY